jgi:hypothetical protein
LRTRRNIVLGDFNSTINEHMAKEIEEMGLSSQTPRFIQSKTWTWKSGRGGRGRVINHICYSTRFMKEVTSVRIVKPHTVTNHNMVKGRIYIKRYGLKLKENPSKPMCGENITKDDTILEIEIQKAYAVVEEHQMKNNLKNKTVKLQEK